MERIPEPELMDSEEQARAYAEADFSDANSLFVNAFLEQSGGATEAGKLVDLGCGPGDICLRLARAMPQWTLVGLDAGPNMLKHARAAASRDRLADRVEWRQCYLPDPDLPAAGFDAVISNSLLHHLPDPAVLWDTVRQVGAPGARVQVMDLVRPPDVAAATATVERHAADAPTVLKRDFYHSLLAAYTTDEIAEQLDRAGLDLQISRPSDRHWMVAGQLPG
ncbi:MAG: class I SAM-dependent methyltransferase [Xanthomonadales bacterium]|nr:class I SAM-dependent methyltransferase [Xanthomonadales bacterium]